jgi:hypothetical protein
MHTQLVPQCRSDTLPAQEVSVTALCCQIGHRVLRILQHHEHLTPHTHLTHLRTTSKEESPVRIMIVPEEEVAVVAEGIQTIQQILYHYQ